MHRLFATLLIAATAGAAHADDAFDGAAGELDAERVVKGAPDCADAVHETIKWLPDAAGGTPNRIVRKQQTRLCRDGDGRTRQEVERQGRSIVYLRDPVAGESWVLDPAAKSARKFGRGGFDGAAWRDYGERMREWARDFKQRMGGSAPATPAAPAAVDAPQPPQPAVVARGERGDRDVRIVRIEPGPAPAPPALPGLPAMPPLLPELQPLAPRGAGVSQPLGSREIDGTRADGVRTSWTIEAGKVGNERPIVIVREVWTAPDLMLTLATRDVDPRSAEVTYRLQNLKRGEPDPALMRVPVGWARP